MYFNDWIVKEMVYRRCDSGDGQCSGIVIPARKNLTNTLKERIIQALPESYYTSVQTNVLKTISTRRLNCEKKNSVFESIIRQ